MGFTEGTARCVSVGMLFVLEIETFSVHSRVIPSICAGVALSGMFSVICESSCLNASQLALENWRRGLIGILMGFVEMVAMTGRWSDAVMGPGLRCML